MGVAQGPNQRRRRSLLSVLGVIVLLALIFGAWRFVMGRQGAAAQINYSLVWPQVGTISATVNATGSIQPRKVVNLNFSTPGVVAEVLVQVGDSVEKGAPIARLDARSLQLQVEQAEAALNQAKANYKRLIEKATPAQLAQAQAQLEQARAQLAQVAGNVTAQDRAAAQAQLQQARANLTQLESGPTATDVQATQAALDQAQTNLQTQRDNLSVAKTNAEAAMNVAANELRDRQDDYSRIHWNNVNLAARRSDEGLPQVLIDQEATALRDVENAQAVLDQAKVAYDLARQNEINGIASAEAQVRTAQANLDKLLSAVTPAQLSTAQAQVAQAEANLAKLQGGQRSGSLDAASAAVDIAQANLDQLRADRAPGEIEAALAQVQQAEALLKQAQLALEGATLRAPIAGVVAGVSLTEGEQPNTTKPAVVLADLSSFHVDVTVDEIDVAQISVGQPITLTLDALPEFALAGTVDAISPLAIDQAGVTSYKVRVAAQTSDRRVRSGMSANVEIVVAQKHDALMVLLRAVRQDHDKILVDTTADPSLCEARRQDWPAAPKLRPIEITTGLSNDEMVEVTSGEGIQSACIYIEGFDARLDLLNGPPPPSLRERRQR